MVTTLMSSAPNAGLSSYGRSSAVTAHSAHTAPEWTEQGTGVSFAGASVLALPVQVAFGARVIDLPGLRPRGAPV